MKPLLLVNFKTYQESEGKKGILLAERLGKVQSEKFEIIVCPSLLILREVSQRCKAYAQHVDDVSYGAHTGHILTQALCEMNVQGTLLNHSERRLSFGTIKSTIAICKRYKLKTVVCASSLREVKTIAGLSPDMIAYEPPELIGGTISVTKAKPDIVKEAVELVQKSNSNVKVLCGAGIQTRNDVQTALKWGCFGVLVASAIVKAKNPVRVLKQMIK